ncbi:MAG: ECF transporter S component [Eubacteriales bacterium]|nr:ECF transporter S component [Eubacteriales bacterium]
MKENAHKLGLYDVVAVGLMAAVVFVVTMFLSIRIPTPTGTTMIKLANAFVLLCGLLLGPVRGGLAAGFGSMLFDLMTPEYAPEAWLTFIRFFLMAWLCGLIAHAGATGARRFARELTACIVAAVFSAVFYLCKGVVTLMLGGSAFAPAFMSNLPKLLTSPPNTIIAVVVAMALYPALRKALDATPFGVRLRQSASR